MALAFEQQPKESDKAFAAFSLYLSQGPGTVAGRGNEEAGPQQSADEMVSKFDWGARVVAYGAHMALVEREAAEAMTREGAWTGRSGIQELREAEWERWGPGDLCG